MKILVSKNKSGVQVALTTQTPDFRPLRLNISAKTKKFAKPFFYCSSCDTVPLTNQNTNIKFILKFLNFWQRRSVMSSALFLWGLYFRKYYNTEYLLLSLKSIFRLHTNNPELISN